MSKGRKKLSLVTGPSTGGLSSLDAGAHLGTGEQERPSIQEPEQSAGALHHLEESKSSGDGESAAESKSGEKSGQKKSSSDLFNGIGGF